MLSASVFFQANHKAILYIRVFHDTDEDYFTFFSKTMKIFSKIIISRFAKIIGFDAS